MDTNDKEANAKPLISSLKGHKEGIVERVFGNDENDESKRLLLPKNDEISKTKRRVQWNDTNGGNKLAEVLEFLPSDVSDNEEDEDSDSCLCTIM